MEPRGAWVTEGDRRELRERLWAIEEAVHLIGQGHVVATQAATLLILRQVKEIREKLL